MPNPALKRICKRHNPFFGCAPLRRRKINTNLSRWKAKYKFPRCRNVLDGIDSIRVFYSSTSPKFVYLLSVLTTGGVQPKSTDWALRPYFRIHSRIFAFILFHHIFSQTKRWFHESWYNSQGCQHSRFFLDDLQENIASWNWISWLNASGWSKTLVFMGAFGEDKTRGTSRSNPPKSKATKSRNLTLNWKV